MSKEIDLDELFQAVENLFIALKIDPYTVDFPKIKEKVYKALEVIDETHTEDKELSKNLTIDYNVSEYVRGIMQENMKLIKNYINKTGYFAEKKMEN